MQLKDIEQTLKVVDKQAFDFVYQSGELTVTVPKDMLKNVCSVLKRACQFEQLMDLTGIDYLDYGKSDWTAESSTSTGFSRGTKDNLGDINKSGSDFKSSDIKYTPEQRFGVVVHLLSLKRNLRVRVKSFVSEDDLHVDSLVSVWPVANWYEREAFDLFGIMFDGHPDLRRILTDYGFVGHPFRKDFPLIGNVQMRYDNNLQRIVYEPVDIKPRILEPKVIRRDSRYESSKYDGVHKSKSKQQKGVN